MLPFETYSHGGRTLLGVNPLGNGSCRRGYGLPIVEQCGTTCVFCGENLGASYFAWLSLSIDHVIPHGCVKSLGFPSEWIEDITNKVVCCRACNEFLNGYRVSKVPANLEEFYDLRDTVFLDKLQRVNVRHTTEKQFFESWSASVSDGRIPAECVE